MKTFQFMLLLWAAFSLSLVYAETLPASDGSPEPSTTVEGEKKLKIKPLVPGDIKAFRVKGEVLLLDTEDNVIGTLKKGQVIQQGAIVKTKDNASAVLMFSNGSTLSLGKQSRLEIEVYLQADFDKSQGIYAHLQADPSTSRTHAFLTHGELVGSVRKLQKTSTFDVETPVGTASIRGTTFYLAFGRNPFSDNGIMLVSNIEGEVLIDSPLQGELLMSDSGVSVGGYDPYADPKLYDVPEKTLIAIETDSPFDVPGEIPIYSPVSKFADFLKQTHIENLLQDITLITGGNPLDLKPKVSPEFKRSTDPRVFNDPRFFIDPETEEETGDPLPEEEPVVSP